MMRDGEYSIQNASCFHTMHVNVAGEWPFVVQMTTLVLFVNQSVWVTPLRLRVKWSAICY